MTAELMATVATGIILCGTVWLTLSLLRQPLHVAQKLPRKGPKGVSRGRREAS